MKVSSNREQHSCLRRASARPHPGLDGVTHRCSSDHGLLRRASALALTRAVATTLMETIAVLQVVTPIIWRSHVQVTDCRDGLSVRQLWWRLHERRSFPIAAATSPVADQCERSAHDGGAPCSRSGARNLPRLRPADHVSPLRLAMAGSASLRLAFVAIRS
jgi:hypothetical protein